MEAARREKIFNQPAVAITRQARCGFPFRRNLYATRIIAAMSN
jgi:hypothetical protein